MALPRVLLSWALQRAHLSHGHRVRVVTALSSPTMLGTAGTSRGQPQVRRGGLDACVLRLCRALCHSAPLRAPTIPSPPLGTEGPGALRPPAGSSRVGS